jgi:hypothetical protein
MRELDTQSRLVQAKREGRQERSIEIARGLKSSNIPYSQIALWTGLSPEEIAAL